MMQRVPTKRGSGRETAQPAWPGPSNSILADAAQICRCTVKHPSDHPNPLRFRRYRLRIAFSQNLTPALRILSVQAILPYRFNKLRMFPKARAVSWYFAGIYSCQAHSRHLAIPRYQTTLIPFSDTSPHHVASQNPPDPRPSLLFATAVVSHSIQREILLRLSVSASKTPDARAKLVLEVPELLPV
jgi:hypothetical protein